MVATDRHYRLALDLLRQSRIPEAEHACREILQSDPRHIGTLNLLGALALQRGDPRTAIQLLQRSISINPNAPEVHLNLGTAQIHVSQPELALESYSKALALRPRFPDALRSRAAVLSTLGRANEALLDFDRALSLTPDSVPLLLSRGNLLFEQGRIADAVADYERARALAPNDSDLAFNCGSAYLGLKDYGRALASFETAIKLRPSFAKAYHYRGLVLRRLWRHEEALQSFVRSTVLDPKQVKSFCGMGNSLRELGRFEDAIQCFDRALQLTPDTPEAICSKGRVLLSLNRAEEASRCLERLLELPSEAGRHDDYALGHLLHARLMCCDWRDYDSLSNEITTAVMAGKAVTLPSLLLVTSDSPDAQRECASAFYRENWASISASPASTASSADSRIRVAYVSSDFREHPVSQLLVRLIETHDRERFEIFGIALRPKHESELGHRIASAFDHFIDATDVGDAEVAATMRRLNIDIAVDLNGYTDGCRPGIFAHRAAPVQVGYLGYAGTLGAPYMDYIIADRTVIPEDAQQFYAEKVAHLPDCFLPNDAELTLGDVPPDRASHGLPEQGFVFCCFNNHYKITPTMFRLWMTLLRSIEGSVLWLAKRSDIVIQNLRREAHECGVDPNRLIFAERTPKLQDHLARQRLADLFLDTLPFNAHTTACNALWAGLPVLTCAGQSYAGRVAASLLTAVGLPELITTSLDSYRELALHLATTPTKLAELRQRLAENRSRCALFNGDRYRGHLETAYTFMRDKHRRGG